MVVFFTFLCPVQLPSLDHQYLSPSSEADVHFQPPQQHLRAKINFHHAALFYYFNGLVLLGVRHTLPMNKKLVNVSLWSCFIHMSPDCLNTKLLCYTSHWQTLSTVLSQRLISFLAYGVWGDNTHMGWQQHIVSRHQISVPLLMVGFLKHETLVKKTVVERDNLHKSPVLEFNEANIFFSVATKSFLDACEWVSKKAKRTLPTYCCLL